jgi:hypothetical protein
MSMSPFRRLALLALLLAPAGCSTQAANENENVVAEEPTAGTLELAPAGTSASFRPASTAPTDPASINAPVLLVNGERLQLRRVEQ